MLCMYTEGSHIHRFCIHCLTYSWMQAPGPHCCPPSRALQRPALLLSHAEAMCMCSVGVNLAIEAKQQHLDFFHKTGRDIFMRTRALSGFIQIRLFVLIRMTEYCK